MGEQPKVTLYNCPVCNKDNRLGKKLSDEVKERGLMREELNYYLYQFDAVVKDPLKEAKLPIGGKLPAFRIFLDMCLDCGCYYVAKLELSEAVKRVKPVKPDVNLPPNLPFAKG